MALTLRNVRDNMDLSKIGSTGLRNDQKLKRAILQREYHATGDNALAAVLAKQDKLLARHNRAKEYAPTRKFRKNASRPTPGTRKDYHTPEGFNEHGLNVGRSYASQAGMRMERKKAGFPDVMRHAATIDVSIEPFDVVLSQVVHVKRTKMRKVFDGLTDGKQIEGMFQIVMKTAKYLATIFPEAELPPGFDPVARPDEIFALLHWHGDISDPWKTKKEIRQLLATAYPGCRRVCVAKVQPVRTTSDGQITGGAQGYLEYAAQEKTKLDFKTKEQKKEALFGQVRLECTWNRRNRQFSMGKPLAVTGTKINPDRVAALETRERLEVVRSKWNSLTPAEQFIHSWFSGVVSVINKSPTWVAFASQARDRFVLALALIRNWSADPDTEDIGFFDYSEPLLE